MNKRVTSLAITAWICSVAATGQVGAIVGSGYVAPTPLTAAPGQIITISVSGVGSGVIRRVEASAAPLPTSLAGISVSLTQLLPPKGPILAPLLAVYPMNGCAIPGVLPCSSLLAVTLQIPLELAVNNPLQGALSNSAQLVASDGTTTSAAVQLNAVPDRVHVLQFGDTVVQGTGTGPIVTHAGGNLVSSANPARTGEELVLYAVGLGATTPAAIDGAPSPEAKTLSQFVLAFDYRPNATPSAMLISSSLRAPGPIPVPVSIALYSGLVPGYVGLYQINFQVPVAPGPLSACGVDGVISNLTVDIIGAMFDGAGICVEPQGATGASATSPSAR